MFHNGLQLSLRCFPAQPLKTGQESNSDKEKKRTGQSDKRKGSRQQLWTWQFEDKQPRGFELTCKIHDVPPIHTVLTTPWCDSHGLRGPVRHHWVALILSWEDSPIIWQMFGNFPTWSQSTLCLHQDGKHQESNVLFSIVGQTAISKSITTRTDTVQVRN
jgi:hypothetical protein